ncbi:MAG: TRAP transporter small permease [Deltaproteobacteria bacterium]|nr:MAG: TRAP transporter small permease [Deltaproteobacteria bacterium]
MSQQISEIADTIGRRVNWLVERCCALLMAVMVLVVWFGVTERYFLRMGATWTEEFSRYVMIWVALLAISCAAYRREHIGLIFIIQRLTGTRRRILQCALDLIGLVFFIFLAVYGTSMTVAGQSQYATIFGISMAVPFASVPVSAALAAFQILVTMIRDLTLSDDPVGNAS